MSLLPPPLRLLIRLHAKGVFRRLTRKAKGPKGIALTIIGGLVVFLWLSMMVAPNLIQAYFGRHKAPTTQSIAAVVRSQEMAREFAPVVLLALCFLTLLGSTAGRGIAFTPAETDFLFPGPYTRRQIIMYRLARSWMPSLWGALLFGTGMRRFSVSWLGTYVVAVLVLVFIQTFSTAAALAFSAIEERISASKFRRVVLGAGVALCAAAIYLVPAPKVPDKPSANAVNEMMMGIVRSPLTQKLSAPFRPFAYAMTAPTWGELALWTAVCVLIIIVTLAITLRIDAEFFETSTANAVKTQEKLDKARSGKMTFEPGSTRLRLPPLPRLGGVGAIVWRQGTTGLRAMKVVLFVLTIACFSMAPLLMVKGLKDTKAVAGLVVSMIAMFTFMGGALFRFDFRGDIDRMDTLKALPISPMAVVVGQLATPMLFMAFFQLCLLVVLGVLVPQYLPKILIAAAFVPLFSLAFTEVENLGFLLFPHRGQVAPGDLAAMARGALLVIAKLITVALMAGIALGLWWLTRWATGSTPAALTTAWLAATALVLSLLPLLAFAYHRFDISAEITADA